MTSSCCKHAIAWFVLSLTLFIDSLYLLVQSQAKIHPLPRFTASRNFCLNNKYVSCFMCSSIVFFFRREKSWMIYAQFLLPKDHFATNWYCETTETCVYSILCRIFSLWILLNPKITIYIARKACWCSFWDGNCHKVPINFHSTTCSHKVLGSIAQQESTRGRFTNIA